MQIQNTTSNYAAMAAIKASTPQSTVETAEEGKKQNSTSKTDSYNKSADNAKAAVYEEPKRLTADQLKDLSEQRIGSFTKMLEGMFGKQVDFFKKSTYDNLKVDAATSAKAQAAISPGGEWSPDAVAGRILDMAKALSGGDPSKISTLKNAVLKGFGEAGKAWGGKLPSVCDETYDKVMKGFDEWENESKVTTE